MKNSDSLDNPVFVIVEVDYDYIATHGVFRRRSDAEGHVEHLWKVRVMQDPAIYGSGFELNATNFYKIEEVEFYDRGSDESE